MVVLAFAALVLAVMMNTAWKLRAQAKAGRIRRPSWIPAPPTIWAIRLPSPCGAAASP